jgi:hypothetical protein
VNFAKGYKEAQLWVRENTDISALFFPEPTTFHGWRAYAQRSSFGTIFEWLADSWLYNRDFPLFTEGQKRFAEFGINLKDYYEQPGNVAGKLAKAASEIYYSSDDSWRLSIAERYGIDYFVMKKELMVRKIDLPVAFENEQVVIYKVEQLH